MNRVLIVLKLVNKLKNTPVSSKSTGLNLFFHRRSWVLRDKETKKVPTIWKLHQGMMNTV